MVLFNDATRTVLSAINQDAKKLYWQCCFDLTLCQFFTILLIGILILEGHILYTLFDGLGGGGDYWSPGLMSLTAFVIVLGFHLLSHDNPNNIALRFINACSQWIIIFYVIGAGLVLTGLMIGDGLSEIFDTGSITLSSLDPSNDANGIESAFINLAHPFASILFSLGIGGLAIINIFAAHRLISKIAKKLLPAFSGIKTAKETQAQYKIAMDEEQTYLDDDDKLNDPVWLNIEDHIAQQSASDILATINKALTPHEEYLKEKLLSPEQEKPIIGDGEANDEVDLKQLEKMIARIRAIDEATILKAISPTQEKRK